MKQRPILFSTPMVQAILAGRKTQTRRVIKEQPKHNQEYGQGTTKTGGRHWVFGVTGSSIVDVIKCPYGQPGDVLWVRETWFNNAGFGAPVYVYRADGEFSDQFHRYSTYKWLRDQCKWKPSIFMPKDAARVWLRITNVRVERLQDINRKEAILEGFPFPNKLDGQDPKKWFSDIWQSINGTDSWNANPWVWVVEFERIEKPQNA